MMTAKEARRAWLIAESHYYDCYTRDTRVAQEWMISPCTSMETLRAHFIATGLQLHYLRLRTEERAARKACRVRRRLQEVAS